MGDFISEFNRKQMEFVKEKNYVSEIMGNISEELKSTMGGEWVVAHLTAQVERNVVLSMQGYAHWLASQLVRSGDFEKTVVKLPVCEEKYLSWISTKYDVPIDFVQAFVSRIVWVGTGSFPLLGSFTADGSFVPDKVALESYKASFDWSK